MFRSLASLSTFPALAPIPGSSRLTASVARVISTPLSLARRRRRFHASANRSDFHFDTHHFVQRLEREGLNRAQAEGIMTAMAEVIDESIRNMTSNMVTKADQEKVCPSSPAQRAPTLTQTLRAAANTSTTTRSRSTSRSSSRSCS